MDEPSTSASSGSPVEQEMICTVETVLTQFELKEFVSLMEQEKVDSLELFSTILEQDLQTLLVNHELGILLRFRQAVKFAKKIVDEAYGELPEAQNEPPAKRKKTENVLIPNDCRVDLENILKSFRGQAILNHYESNGKQLNTVNQGKLLKLIIEEVAKDVEFEDMKKNWFKIIFKKITEKFPSEKTYESSYFTRFSNIKHKLNQIKKAEAKTKQENQEDQEAVVESDEAAAQQSKEWLIHGRETTEMVEDHWGKSFILRQKVYKESRNQRLADLWAEDMWPILKTPVGLKLINLDFAKMFQTKTNIRELFPILKLKIMPYARSNMTSKPKHLQLLKSFERNPEDNFKFVKVLAALLPAGTVAQHYRPNMEETLAGYVREVKTVNDIEPEMEKYRSKMAEYNLTVQPHVIYVNGAGLQAFYVYADRGQYYVTGGLLEAIDGVVKLCMVLNSQYPPDARPCWTFTQRYFYNLESSSDSKLNCVKSLLGFLEKSENK